MQGILEGKIMASKEYHVEVDDNNVTFWYIFSDGSKVLHRDDGPAVESHLGRWWYMNGNLHRIGAAAAEHISGNKYYYEYGQRHREDGPAEIYNGQEAYYLNDKLYSKDDFDKEIEKRQGLGLTLSSDDTVICDHCKKLVCATYTSECLKEGHCACSASEKSGLRSMHMEKQKKQTNIVCSKNR